jgi:hypothetical protein
MANPTIIKGWPGGMDNILPDYDLPVNDKGIQNTLRNAVNVDVLPSGRVKRRSGTTQKITARVHSLFANGDTALAVIDNALSLVKPDFSHSSIASLSTTAKVSYVHIADNVFYSNGVNKGRVVGGVNKHWGVENPASAPTITVTGGALPTGRYMAVVTYVDATGEESGCGNSAYVELANNSGITLSIPQPSQAYVTGIRVYMTSTNDSVLYEIATLPVGQTSMSVVIMPEFGMALETQFMAPFLATELIKEYNGRIYGATSNILWHTQPLRYGLYKPSSDFIVFPAPISVVAVADDGLYVIADKTYWLAGNSPDEFTITTVMQYTAAKGSDSTLPNSKDVIWYSSAGLVRASGGGQVKLIQEPHVRGAPSDSGATAYIESAGIKKVVASVSGEPFATGLSSTDYMDAEIERARR